MAKDVIRVRTPIKLDNLQLTIKVGRLFMSPADLYKSDAKMAELIFTGTFKKEI